MNAPGVGLGLAPRPHVWVRTESDFLGDRARMHWGATRMLPAGREEGSLRGAVVDFIVKAQTSWIHVLLSSLHMVRSLWLMLLNLRLIIPRFGY